VQEANLDKNLDDEFNIDRQAGRRVVDEIITPVFDRPGNFEGRTGTTVRRIQKNLKT
jgi:hypothetical protein